MTQDFTPWPKIARLNRTITITEKLDGTNAAVVIVPLDRLDSVHDSSFDGTIDLHVISDPHLIAQVDDFGVFAQSRSRLITPGKSTDNYGFAGWVNANAEALVSTLGEGTHFGEWWGSGIQRGYGLPGGEKRFSLFNTARWSTGEGSVLLEESPVEALDVVPVLYEGPFSEVSIRRTTHELRLFGSAAAPGFAKPEGIVIFHHASRDMFKVTLEGDEAPKGEYAHRNDERTAA